MVDTINVLPQLDNESFASDELHLYTPNAFNEKDIVNIINGEKERQPPNFCLNLCCHLWSCCGCLCVSCNCKRCFTSKVGEIAIGLDGNNRPIAFNSNQFTCANDPLLTLLGSYKMTDSLPFQQSGVVIIKVDGGSVVFADDSGTPVIISHDESKRTGWFVTTKPGFHVAERININGQPSYSPGCKASETYINFQSLHIFNVQPNTVHVVAYANESRNIQYKALLPRRYIFNAPFMRSVQVISTAIEDYTFDEPSAISTSDGVMLSECKAVLRCQVLADEIDKLLQINVENMAQTLTDSARRTLLHEISAVPYQGYYDRKQFPGTEFEQAESGVGVVGNKHQEHVSEGFRYELENRMIASLTDALRPLGIKVISFALQSFKPPRALTENVIRAIAQRTEAGINRQAADAENSTKLARAKAEAESVVTIREAEAKAIAVQAHAQAEAIVAKGRAESETIVLRAQAMKQAEVATGVSALKLQGWEARAKTVSALSEGNLRTLIGGSTGGMQLRISAGSKPEPASRPVQSVAPPVVQFAQPTQLPSPPPTPPASESSAAKSSTHTKKIAKR